MSLQYTPALRGSRDAHPPDFSLCRAACIYSVGCLPAPPSTSLLGSRVGAEEGNANALYAGRSALEDRGGCVPAFLQTNTSPLLRWLLVPVASSEHVARHVMQWR